MGTYGVEIIGYRAAYFVHPDGRYDPAPGDITMKLVNRKNEKKEEEEEENKQAISPSLLPSSVLF